MVCVFVSILYDMTVFIHLTNLSVGFLLGQSVKHRSYTGSCSVGQQDVCVLRAHSLLGFKYLISTKAS